MKDTKFKELSTEELKVKAKSLKLMTGLLLGSLSTLFALSLYNTITQKFTPLLVMPVALLPIVIINFSTINKIKAELSSREE